MIATVCPSCGHEYLERDETSAQRPDRCCSKCWSAQARKYQAKNPAPEKHIANTCRSCGAEIQWVKTAAGKNMPIDAETAETGDDLFDAKRHTAHFATCPHADQHRRSR